MTFQATKCDECGALKGESNHWLSLTVWESASAGVVAIATGMLQDHLKLERCEPPLSPATLDICGQSCAMKQIARLLGWTSSKETAV